MNRASVSITTPGWICLCTLGMWALLVAPLPAQRAVKLGGPRGAASVQGLLLAASEDDKSRIFIQLRHSLTPSDVLAIVQNERSPSIAALAVGVYLEKSNVQPREAAQILFQLAQHPGQHGLAATLGAISGHAGPIAGELATVDTRGRTAGPRLLAADMLATYAWLASHPESPSGDAAAADSPAALRRGRKAGRHQRAQIRQPAAEVTGPLDKLVTAKEPEVLEAAVLAAAWLRYEDAGSKIAALEDTRQPGLLAARLLYLARLGEPVSEAMVQRVFAHSPAATARYIDLAPTLATYDIRSSPWAYGCEALGELGTPYLKYLHEALNHRDLRVQIEAIRAIEKIGSPQSVPELLKKITTGRTPWPVLVYGLSAVGAIPARDSVPALLDRLARENGRFRLDLNYALASITGAQQGTTTDEWNEWWKANGPGFAVDAERSAAFRREHRVQDMRVPSVGLFYNLGLYSERLVFVLDTSMSMRGERIASLKRNLTNTLQGMTAKVQFNVIDFGGHISLMKPSGLITEPELPLVLPRVEYMSLSTGTRTYDALEMAISLSGVDTLVLLSDGAPVTGKFEAWPRIVAALAVLDRYYPVAIWGIEYDARERNVGGMQECTDRNWGHTRASQP